MEAQSQAALTSPRCHRRPEQPGGHYGSEKSRRKEAGKKSSSKKSEV